MSRRRREGLSPSLFPFLAVLVCTLGTLILFLALVAQNATESAEQKSRNERAALAKLRAAPTTAAAPRLAAEAVQSMIRAERFRVDQLVAFRDQQTANLAERRDQLTHIEDHLARLRQKLERLSDEVDNAMGETTVEKIEEGVIQGLRARIDAERTDVEKLRSESENKTPRVVIVPHKGPNGTDRRPVYLECTDQGVTIWPEGSQITTTHLEDADRTANPLDAALRVIRHHAMQQYGDAAPPYPLLVVRPNGIEAYAAARNAMLDWDDQFGYELVPADVELAFSKPDPNLKQRVELAIRTAAAGQHARHALARRAIGSDRQGRMPTLSAASLDRDGRSNGFRSLQDDYAIGGSQSGQSPYVSHSPYIQTGSGKRFDDAVGGDNAGTSSHRWDDAMRSAADEIRDANLPAGGNPEVGNHHRETAAAGRQDNPFPMPKEHVDAGGATDEANTAEFADPTYAQDPLPGFSATSSTDSRTRWTSNESSNESANPSSDAEQSSRQPPLQAEHSRPAATEPAAGQGGSHSTPPSTAMMSPQTGINPSTQRPEPTTAAPPEVNVDATAAPQSVRRQGRDWALPSNLVGMHGNAIVRTIRVQCYQDRFVLLPPASGGATEIFGLANGDVDRATLQLATAVRDRIEQWGAALPGGRWQPRLDVEVMPRGEIRFHQLRTLMSSSGVEVTGRTSK